MRTFAPLAERNLPVPGELLDALVETLGPPGPWVLIGATARDLALILGGVTLPRRATNDVDIAVAADDAGDFDALLATIGEPTRAWQRRRLLGQQVDVVPFGELEREGDVVIHESSLSVLGCAEAAANADLVTLPSGRLLPVAPLELMAVLKLIAFAGRHPPKPRMPTISSLCCARPRRASTATRPGTTNAPWRPPTSTMSWPAPIDSAVEASLASSPTGPCGSTRWQSKFTLRCGSHGGEPTKDS